MAVRIQDDQAVTLMIQGIGATVSIGPPGGALTLAWTTVDELEIGTLVGPLDVEVALDTLHRYSRDR